MARSSRGNSPRRVAEFSELADADLAEIYLHTAHYWTVLQAEIYDEFLAAIIQQLAENPALAPAVPGRKGIKVYIARWRKAGHGHRIFFEETETGISVLRILHTSMNWQDYIGDRD